MKTVATRPTRVLLTRSHDGNEELAERLRSMGFEPVTTDAIKLDAPEDWSDVDRELSLLESYDWLLLTSPTGAKYLLERASILNINLSDIRTKIAVVGPRTGSLLRSRGLKVDFVPSEFQTARLAEQLPKSGKRVLLMHSDRAGKSASLILQSRGFAVTDVILYLTRLVPITAFESVMEADLVTFGSPSAVEGLCSQIPPEELDRLLGKETICIGPVTAAAARAHGFASVKEVGNGHTFDALLKELGDRGSKSNA